MLSLAFLLHVEQQTGSYGAAGLACRTRVEQVSRSGVTVEHVPVPAQPATSR